MTYKLLFDIEALIDLKEVFEEFILNVKVEFPLKEILRIVKKKFPDVTIDQLKKR